MSDYIAFLDENNIVTHVVKSPDDGQDWAEIWSAKHSCQCVVTSKDGSIRHQYGAPGSTYYQDIDSFIGPSIFPSWVLDKSSKTWEAPVPMPSDDTFEYDWDEETKSWQKVIE